MTLKAKSSKRRRRDKSFVALNFEVTFVLGTLSDNIVLANDLLGASFGEDIYIVSIDWTAAIKNMTQGEVPLYMGFNHGDLSVTEIAEALDANLVNPDDIIAKERSRRPVRRAGMFNLNAVDIILHDGVMKRTKILFSVGNGFGLQVYVRNSSGAGLTTGAAFEMQGTIYGRWQR